MNPSYQLIPVLQTPEISPGDPIKVTVFVSGAGNVDKNKFYVNHNHDEIVDPDDSGFIKFSISDAHDKDTDEYLQPATGERYLGKHQLDTVGTYIRLTKSFFVGDDRKNYPNRALPHGIAEQTHDKHAPLEYQLNTKTEALPGNYEITFSLSYSSGEDISQDVKTVTVHVNNWREDHQKELEVVGVVGTIVVLLAFFVSVGSLLITAGLV